MESKVTLLIVDDEAPIRRVLRMFLEDVPERESFDILEAEDGAQALELIRTKDIPLVLADVKMPRMSGFDLLEVVRKEKPETVFVVMTGYSDIHSRKEALVLGAEDYITKPFTRDEVELVVRGGYWRVLALRMAP